MTVGRSVPGGVGVALEGVGVDAVVFDCDGTLVDSERIANEVFAALISAEGLPTTVEDCVARFMGRAASACLAMIEEGLGRPVRSALLAERTRLVDQRLAAELRPVPGIPDLLDALAATGTPLAVASSSTPAEIRFRLTRTGLGGYFGDRLFSATEVPRGKPAPDVYLHAARALGAEPARCVAIEDSPSGVRAAAAAGLRVIGFADLIGPDALRAAGADEIVRDPAEIARLVAVS